jgi:GNAT superfamily N-acetyltransferase
MTDAAPESRRLAAMLPDIPRWLETRGMLLAGSVDFAGVREEGPHFVVRDRATGLISIVGRPDPAAVQEMLNATRGSTEPVLAPGEEPDYVASMLPRWRREAAVLHLLASSASLPRFVVAGAGGMIASPYVDPEVSPVERRGDEVVMRFVTTAELAGAAGIPDDLRRELTIAVLRGRLAATLVNGVAAAFCYAAWATETLWDVSIDTLHPFRRRGYAGLCVAYLVDQMAREGKRPVWGAMESNEPSLRLASKLGFRPVDRITIFRRPD